MWNTGFLVSPKWMHQNLLKHFRRGTQMTKTNPTAHNRYGIALYNSGEFEKALSAFSSAVLQAGTTSYQSWIFILVMQLVHVFSSWIGCPWPQLRRCRRCFLCKRSYEPGNDSYAPEEQQYRLVGIQHRIPEYCVRYNEWERKLAFLECLSVWRGREFVSDWKTKQPSECQ